MVLKRNYSLWWRYLHCFPPVGWTASDCRLVWSGRGAHAPCGHYYLDEDLSKRNWTWLSLVNFVHFHPNHLLVDEKTQGLWCFFCARCARRGAGHMVPISKPKVARAIFQAFIEEPSWSCLWMKIKRLAFCNKGLWILDMYNSIFLGAFNGFKLKLSIDIVFVSTKSSSK